MKLKVDTINFNKNKNMSEGPKNFNPEGMFPGQSPEGPEEGSPEEEKEVQSEEKAEEITRQYNDLSEEQKLEVLTKIFGEQNVKSYERWYYQEFTGGQGHAPLENYTMEQMNTGGKSPAGVEAVKYAKEYNIFGEYLEKNKGNEERMQEIKGMIEGAKGTSQGLGQEGYSEEVNEPKKSPEQKEDSLTEWAKNRANNYLEQGKLKEAIDSMVSDLGKDPNRAEEQKDIVRMMGMTLRNDPELNEEKAREMIFL